MILYDQRPQHMLRQEHRRSRNRMARTTGQVSGGGSRRGRVRRKRFARGSGVLARLGLAETAARNFVLDEIKSPADHRRPIVIAGPVPS
jgi:hypothetical protein